MDSRGRKIEVEDADGVGEMQDQEPQATDNEAPGEASAQEAGDAAQGDAETVAELRAEVDRLRAALDEEHERHLRAVADLQNFRRRTSRDMQERSRYEGQEVLARILPVMDNLQRILEHEAQSNAEEFATGVRMTVDEFFRVLDQLGVTVVDCAGEAFDPALHDAVARVETDELPAGTIIEVDTPGYCLHDRCLRPARVVVAASSEEEEERS